MNGDRPFPDGAAIVIGGSGGIGSEICRRLAEHGADVALTYRANRAGAEAAVSLVEEAGRRAYAGALDLGDGEGVRAYFAEVASRFGAIHTVVFAIGAEIPMVYAAEIDEKSWHETLDGDLTGFFHVVKAAVPHLRERGGAIVALTTAGLRRHPPLDSLSTVPKAGIEALMRAVAREEGRHGIRANCVALGVVEAGQFYRVEQELPDGFVDAIKRNTALRRLGTAREAADAVVFLASPASGYTTGHSLTVDGGYSA